MRRVTPSNAIDPSRVQIRLLPETRAPVEPDGPSGSVQEAEALVPEDLLAQLWRLSYLERLAHGYWRHLRRISLGLIRVLYTPGSRSVVFIHRRAVLLRFRRPRYDTGLGFGQVTWPIERGLLVAMRGRGHLRISVRRTEPSPEDPGMRPGSASGPRSATSILCCAAVAALPASAPAYTRPPSCASTSW